MRYVIEAIDRKQLDADVLFPQRRGDSLYAEKSFVHFSRFASLFYYRFPGSWVLTSLYIFWTLGILRRGRSYSRIWFADRFTSLFCVISRRIWKKSIIMVNDDTRIQRRRWHRKGDTRRFLRIRYWSILVFWYLERMLCRRSLLVVANSDYLAQGLAEEYSLGRKPVCLYKAVDLETFTRRTSDPCSGPYISVLFVKNEWRRGGLDTLLEALRLLGRDDVTLTVAGVADSLQRQAIDTLARKAGLADRVELKGLVGRHEMPSLFQQADILCVPSRSEALGVVFLEALATGTPVVASNVGGIPEVLDHGRAGWMVSPGDAMELSKTLSVVLSDSHLRRQKQEAGFWHVRSFSTDRMIVRIKQIAATEVASLARQLEAGLGPT